MTDRRERPWRRKRRRLAAGLLTAVLLVAYPMSLTGVYYLTGRGAIVPAGRTGRS